MMTKTEPIRPPPLPGISGVPDSDSSIAWEPVLHKTRQKSMSLKDGAETAVRDIRRKTRKQYSAEEKIRIVLSGLRGEDSIAELCRREGIAESLYYSWSKEFLEAGKKRLSGDTARQASSGEIKDLRREMHDLKEALAQQVLENRLLKKSMIGDGGDGA